MFKIEDVKDFLEGFAEKEYHINRNKFDLTIPEDEFCEDVQTFLETYFSLYYIELKTGSLMTRSLDDLDEETIEWNRNSFIKRKVYVIRHFQNATFGEIHTDCKEVFSCFLGSDSDIVGVDVYTDNFYVGIVENKLKIISARTLKSNHDRSAKLVWEYAKNSVEWSDNVMILKEGDLIDVLRVMEPDLDSWKEDYFG